MNLAEANALIAVARSQIGYLEKKSNAKLDEFTANAGDKNFTKYNRDYIAWCGSGAIDMQWCAAFVSWCFVKAYGLDTAKKLLCGGLHRYTPTGAERFKRANRYIRRGQGQPRTGDVVYFYSKAKGRIGHVGIVVSADEKYVITIEGNTTGANRLITNGGGVCEKKYKLTSTYIDGYGRPDYSCALMRGSAGEDVRALQENLNALGYECEADGVFGAETERALKVFQADCALECDGIFGEKTRAALLARLGNVVVTGDSVWLWDAPPALGGKKAKIVHKGDRLSAIAEYMPVSEGEKVFWIRRKYAKEG